MTGKELRDELTRSCAFHEAWGHTKALSQVVRWSGRVLLVGYFLLIGFGHHWLAAAAMGLNVACMVCRLVLSRRFERLLDERLRGFPTGFLAVLVADTELDGESRKAAREELAKRAAEERRKADHALN